MRNGIWLAMIAVLALGSACSKKDDSTSTTISSTTEETGQQVGDAMASVDEFGGSGGSIASLEGEKKIFARFLPAGSMRSGDSPFLNSLVPRAEAASCLTGSTWGTCTANVITRTFGSCTIGGATLTGTVKLTYTDGTVDSTCAMATNGDSIARNPDFTLTTSAGGTYTVSKTGTNGQKVERVSAGNFKFSNDGIRRVITYKGTTLYDMTTTTTSDITVTGSARSGRVMTGGSLRTTNNLTSVTCDFVPSSVTWSGTCNCPSSGSWTASCSDSKTGSLAITGCGTGTLTLGTTSTSLTFDRCYGI